MFQSDDTERISLLADYAFNNFKYRVSFFFKLIFFIVLRLHDRPFSKGPFKDLSGGGGAGRGLSK